MTKRIWQFSPGLIRAGLAKRTSPYRETALHSLRRMTGRDAGQTAQEWRAALGL